MGINTENKLTTHLSETKSCNELQRGNTVDAMMHKHTGKEQISAWPAGSFTSARWYYVFFGAAVLIHKLVLSKHVMV